MNLSALFTAYNQAKWYAKRTGEFDVGNVDRALGLLMAHRLGGKRREDAFEAMFPWSVAWLDGMRRTGQLISAGQEAETIVGDHGKGRTSGNRLLLVYLGLDKMQASRWPRLADIHD